MCCGLLLSSSLAQAQNPGQKLNRQFQAAVADYDAGRFPEASAQLEKLLPEAPKSFELHELLGLTYAAQSQEAKAIEQFQIAVRLKPDSAVARTNLATGFAHAGKPEQAAEQLRKAIDLDPKDFQANHNLGEFYVQSGKIDEARPLLEAAHRADPTSYDNGYDLAQALFMTGRLGEARREVDSLLKQKNAGELHNLLAQIDEQDGQFLQAANEYEVAAHMDPTEENIFDWASELLLHRTYEPAIEVFQKGADRYPDSPRLLIGLGMSLYSRGKYDEAVKALIAAADLNPSDARCYLFLSKAYDSSPHLAEDAIERFRRYAELQPGNALAQYYYAMSLWKGKRTEDFSPNLGAVEALLRKAVVLDDRLPQAHLQLGILYADQREYAQSLPEYQRALDLDPNLSDAHYRLGQYYVHAGQKDRAQQEFDIYQKLQAQHLAAIDKERAEVQQFVYSAKAASPVKP